MRAGYAIKREGELQADRDAAMVVDKSVMAGLPYFYGRLRGFTVQPEREAYSSHPTNARRAENLGCALDTDTGNITCAPTPAVEEKQTKER